jgi:hypothetical protein
MSLQGQDLQPIEDDPESDIPDSREEALGLVFYDGALYDGLVDYLCFLSCNSMPHVYNLQLSNNC